jgi:vacuolar-type H+-ATPase subunit E/Vma4
MEVNVVIRCRKSDVKLVQEVANDAGNEFKILLKTWVPSFLNKDVNVNLHVEADKFLDEYNPGAVNSCMGGIVLHCRKGRIVCANTIDERLQLVYQIALPDIRRDLFPSIIAAQKVKH